jgi:HSP20 family molecular chaperone IbpA
LLVSIQLCSFVQNWVRKLSSIPTKAEELHVKIDEQSRTLTVSGKSETESTRRDGVKIFSTHVCTKDIRIPEDVELKTIASMLHDDMLTFVAERTQKEEDKIQEIPIEMVDTAALD